MYFRRPDSTSRKKDVSLLPEVRKTSWLYVSCLGTITLNPPSLSAICADFLTLPITILVTVALETIRTCLALDPPHRDSSVTYRPSLKLRLNVIFEDYARGGIQSYQRLSGRSRLNTIEDISVTWWSDRPTGSNRQSAHHLITNP
jgi:hypothetical protein